jgi:peptidoglycan/LPS O-acetylase OafA/YrhL
MKPGTDDRTPALDGLRAVGAFAVILTHVGFQSVASLHGPFAGVLARLDLGVALFFAISGYLLFRPHVVAQLDRAPRSATLNYFKHRALRILPVLWVAVILSATLLPHPGRGAMPFAEHALLVQVYLPDNALEGLTQMWSLATEVAFYLALPAAAAAMARLGHGRTWCIRVLLVCATAQVVGPAWMVWCAATGSPRGHLWLPGFVGWFAAGMALAVWRVGRSRGVLPATSLDVLATRTGSVWALAAAVFAVTTTPIAGPYDLTSPTPGQAGAKNLLYALVALLVVAPTVVATTRRSGPLSTLSSKPAHVLGSISYAVFAYHVVILAVLGRALDLKPFAGGFWVRLGGTVVVSVVAGLASFYLMERPIIRWGRRRESSSGYVAGEPATESAADRPTPAVPSATPLSR